MRSTFLIIAFVTALISGTSVIHFQTEAQTLRARLIKENGEIMNQVHHRLEDKVAQLTEGWINFGEDRRQRATELVQESEAANRAALIWAWTTAGGLVVALLVSLSLEGAFRRRGLAAITLTCWMLGIALPVLTLTVEAQVTEPVDLGKLLLREESKSLTALLWSFWQNQDILMLSLVGAFGLLVPLVKTLCQFMPDDARGALATSKFLAKWSLVDVLVVGVIVAFLGSQGDKEAHAVFRLGFWFFAASGVLGVISSNLMKSNGWLADRNVGNPVREQVPHHFGTTF